MNKGLLLVSISLILLVGVAIVVSAGSMVLKTPSEEKYTVSVEVSKGWNLIMGLPEQSINQDSEIKLGDIGAVYSYSSLDNKYIRIYPNAETKEIQRYDDDYTFSRSMLVYSEKSGNLKYSTIVFSDSSDYIDMKSTIVSGWNFITITPDMVGKSLEDIKGNCIIESAYLWDDKGQQWGTIFNLLDDKNILNSEAGVGKGFIMKASSDCTLSISGTGSMTPPTLP